MGLPELLARNVLKRNLLLNHKVHEYYRNFVRETNVANMSFLFVDFYSLILGRMVIPYRWNTIRMGLSIICFKGPQVDFPN